MLDLSTAVLCDFAQVRDRLLFVSSGAVSRLYRQELPSPLGLMVGLVIEVPLEDAGMEHRLRAEVINRHGTVLATLDNTFRVSDAGLFPHEVQQVPLVLSITGVRARTWGTHQVRLYLDDDLVRALTLYVVPAAAPQAAVRATPTQSRVADDEGTVGAPRTDQPGEGTPAEEEPTPEPATADESLGATEPPPADEPAPDDNAPVSWGESAAPSEPTATPTESPAPSEPEPAFSLDLDPALDLEISPSEPSEPSAQAAPEPEAAPAWRAPTIDAAPARDDEGGSTRSVPQVFDFDEDDLDADPAQRPVEQRAGREPSRFSFRYRYEDDEDPS